MTEPNPPRAQAPASSTNAASFAPGPGPRRLLEARLPAFARPFVTRALRGARGRRAVGLSVLVAVVSVFVGCWLALGSGHLEQGLRQSLGLEEYEYERERSAYTVYTRSPLTADELGAALMSDGMSPGYGSEGWRELDAYRRLSLDPRAAILAMAHSPDDLELALSKDLVTARRFVAAHPHAFEGQVIEDAIARAGSYDPEGPGDSAAYRDDDVWSRPDQLELARIAMAHDLQPRVERYRSPLGAAHALALIGLTAAGAWTLLLLVAAPVAVGAQQAQERHENTLMPLTATSLTAREVVLGLASGPLALIALVAAPQLLLALGAATLLGPYALGTVALGAALTLAVALPLVLTGQLLGHIAGRSHAPGLVTFGLLAVFGPLWLVGMTLARATADLGADESAARLMALVPTAGPLAWLERAFVDVAYDRAADGSAGWTLAISPVVGALVGLAVAALLLRALERHTAATEGPSLSRRESYFGAGLAVALVAYTVPLRGITGADHIGVRASEHYLISIALLAPALALLVMSQVPVLAAPGLRKLPLRRILGDLAAWVGLHLALLTAAGLVLEGELLGVWHPIALAYLGWAIAVLGLLSARTVSYPLGVAGATWAFVCAVMGVVAFVHVIGFSESSGGLGHPLALAEVSPMLGVLQAAMLVAVPLVLGRRLGRRCRLV